MQFPDGTAVLAQGRLGIVPADRPRHPDFAVYLDARWRDDAEVTWPCQVLTWEDFGVPGDVDAMFAAIDDLHRRARNGELVEVACYGGVGRTGTVLACLAVLSGVPATEAVTWVRSNYHPNAVETPAQEDLIARFGERVS